MTKLRQLWLLTALGTLAVMAGGYFLLVTPKNNTAAALGEETETQEQLNTQLRSQIAMLNKQKKNLPAQQNELNKFEALIPPNPALPSLVRALSDAADNAGVELLNISPVLPEFTKQVNAKTGAVVPGKLPAPKGQVVADIPVTMRVSGTYSQVEQFFAEIEEMSRALLVRGFSVKRGKPKTYTASGAQAGAGDEHPTILSATIDATVLMTTKAPVTAVAPTTDTDASAK